MKIRAQILAFLLIFTSLSYSVHAAEKNSNKAQMEVRVMEMQQRTQEIKAMDLKHLSATERSELRHELKGMKAEAKQMAPYIYISAGALILIIILILILL